MCYLSRKEEGGGMLRCAWDGGFGEQTTRTQHDGGSTETPRRSFNQKSGFISQKDFMRSFRKTQFPLKFFNVSFIMTNIKIKLTDLWLN